MIYMDVFAWTINLFNLWYMVLLPCYRAFRLSQYFQSSDSKLEFMPNMTRSKLSYITGKPEQDLGIDFIQCRLWYNDISYYEWMMTENGEMLRHEPDDKKTWLSRLRVRHRTLATGGPIKHNINRTYSTLGVIGWVIKRRVAEEFILSKLGGFDQPYNFTDDWA
jgi:hypothetical protein